MNNETNISHSKLWTICKIAVGILIILTFTSLITPSGVHKPELLGMPYTLWVGIIEALILVGITWIGTRVHPGKDD
ncbi:MAG: hypothetical protein ACI9FN_000520 [Saprospiraceae bacterium]|jgi:hypothetical protein